MATRTRARTLLLIEKVLLRDKSANAESDWIFVGGLRVSVSIRGTFNATVTVYTDNANADEKPPSADANGPNIGIATGPATLSTSYRVNWVKAKITNYVSGTIKGVDLIAGG